MTNKNKSNMMTNKGKSNTKSTSRERTMGPLPSIRTPHEGLEVVSMNLLPKMELYMCSPNLQSKKGGNLKFWGKGSLDLSD
jgi:hypothetical protein